MTGRERAGLPTDGRARAYLSVLLIYPVSLSLSVYHLCSYLSKCENGLSPGETRKD